MRLQEAGVFLAYKNPGAAETRLRRVDMLLAETEMRMRELAAVLDVMMAISLRRLEHGVGLVEEVDADAAKMILRLKWEDVLPLACFQMVAYAGRSE